MSGVVIEHNPDAARLEELGVSSLSCTWEVKKALRKHYSYD
jgi:uncharacterized cupin superfamily protein